MASLVVFLQKLEKEQEVDICCVDVSPDGAIHAAEVARKKFEKARMLLLASLDTSPMAYLKPSIHASSLLLRPFSNEQAKSVIKELLEDMEKDLHKNGAALYTLETKQGKTLIPYKDILYFESRERKIFLCTKSRQFPFYDTLERLEEVLPEHFLRCHKGFIINANNIEQVSFTENIVHLSGGYQIPMSRSHKAAVREAVR